MRKGKKWGIALTEQKTRSISFATLLSSSLLTLVAAAACLRFTIALRAASGGSWQGPLEPLSWPSSATSFSPPSRPLLFSSAFFSLPPPAPAAAAAPPVLIGGVTPASRVTRPSLLGGDASSSASAPASGAA